MARPARPWFSAEKGWWFVHHKGKKVRLAKGKANKKEAEKAFRELLFLEDTNPAPESGEHTVASVIDLYLEHARHHLLERSLYERKLVLQDFAETHGFRKVNDRDCLPFHLTSWIDGRTEWKSAWTKSHAVAVILRPFNWAAKERLIVANPFRGIARRPGAARRPMSDDEFARLVEAAGGRKFKHGPSPGERFIELLRFLRLTGARPGEASKLTWQQIDCERGVVTLQEHKTSKTQRTPRLRLIVLTAEVVALLAVIRRRGEPSDFVFRTFRGTPWNRCSLSLRMRRARAKAGIPDDAKLYGLRHAYGTRAVIGGLDLKTLAELMGHTTTRVTEHYVHIAGAVDHLRRAAEQVNGGAGAAAATPVHEERSPDI